MFKKISILTIVVIVMLSAFSTVSFADDLLVISPAPTFTLDEAATEDIIYDVATLPEEIFDAEIISKLEDISTELADENAKKVQFEPMAFIENLNIMGVGMAGIFIVIGAIILSVALLNKLTAPKPEKKDE